MRNRLIGALVASAIIATPGYAANTYCYTAGGFSACASAAITTNGNNTTLTIAIQNLSNVIGNTVHTVTAFGLYYIVPPSYTGSVPSFQSGQPGWINGTPLSIKSPGPVLGAGQLVKWVAGAQAVKPATGGIVGCPPLPRRATGLSSCNGPLSFTFNLNAGNNFHLNALNVAIQGRNWQSTQTGVLTPQESYVCYSTNRNCVVTSPVPEPATMTLLALGLVGMGGLGVVRRRHRAS